MSGQYAGLDFEGFKALATDPQRSPHEKVGFPDSYREGKAKDILRDVAAKLPALRARGKAVLDVGAGCSDVATSLIALCGERGHRLTLIDSAEMLAQLPAFESTARGKAPRPLSRRLARLRRGAAG